MRRIVEILRVVFLVVVPKNHPSRLSRPSYGLIDIVYIFLGSFTGANRVWLAFQIGQKNGYQYAIEFAERHLKSFQQTAKILLSANQHLNDEIRWLNSVNQYLSSFKLTPVSLNNEPVSRFGRLISTSEKFVDSPHKISVIMPVFNAGNFLERAARSILNQTWRNLELIIIDDASTDNTWEKAQQFALADDRVKLLRNTVNVGPYVSKNLALRIVTGDYVTGQDADDWSHPMRLEHAMNKIMESDGSAKALISMMLRSDDQGTFQVYYDRILRPSGDGIRRQSYISLLIETKCLKNDLGGWDSVRFGGDGELIERAKKVLGSQFLTLDSIGMFCLDNPQGLTNDPVNGISKATGLSDVRKEYKRSFRNWHTNVRLGEARLDFPLVNRPYKAPDAMIVPTDAIEQNIRDQQSALARNQ